MANVKHAAFSDYETLANSVADAVLHANQISRGTLKSELTHIQFNNVNLQLCNMEGAEYIAFGEVSKKVTGLVFNLHNTKDMNMNGKILDKNSFIVHPAGSEHYSKGEHLCHWGYVSIEWKYLNEYSNNFQDETLKLLENFSLYNYKDKSLFEGYKNKLNELRAIAIFRPEVLANQKFSDNIEKDLIEHTISLLISSTPELKRHKSTESQMLIMKKFFDLLHLENFQKIDLNLICIELGISLRTFYYAFEKVYNLSPVKFLEIVRLHEARKVLSRSDYVPGIVTNIALDHGFWHFGRFAEHYKKLFGERPSDTIRKKCLLKK